VAFDQHCQGCHSQTVGKLQSPAGVTTEAFTVPHGRPPSEVDRFVRSELLRQIAGKKELLRTVPLPPSDRLDAPRVPVPSDLGKEADVLTRLAGGALTCQKCHLEVDGQIRPTGTPALWLPAARFDHPAHRKMSCADCHKNGEESAVVRGRDPEPLDVPGIDNCRQCHAPAGRGESPPGYRALWAQVGLPGPGGVRHDCITCHRYHGPRHP
jgi:hypothetical protein